MSPTARPERRLAAILAADVAGYSRLMERDEAGTLDRLKAHRKELAEPLVAEHRGRIVKLMGDGALCEFASVVDAVACAVAIQRGMAEREAGVPEAERIRFRIGVNLGDVIVEGEDIYGDGVNVAARLEQLAEPGGIVVSGTVFDHLRGELGCTFASLGEQHLKNIERPVRAYRMVLGGAARSAGAARAAAARQALARGAAVRQPERRPGAGLLRGRDRRGHHHRPGEGVGPVRHRPQLELRLPGQGRRRRQVGRELGVRYVLEGSVRKAGERVRITGQLIDAASGAHLWAERFDGTLADVFELQDRVAEGVAGAIEPTLRGAEIERARRKPTGSLDAYDLYLRALPQLVTPTAEDNREALRLLERALALDPGYAVALGLKAWCHLNAYLRSWAGDDATERTSGEHAARRALASGRDDPTALAMGGFVLSLLAHDHEAGLAALNRAVALNPNSALAFGASALVHCLAGDYGTAIEHGQRALRLSPFDQLSSRPLIALAYAHLFTGRHQEAAEYAERAVQANPGLDVSHALLVACLVELGRLEEARHAAGRLMATFPTFRIARRRRAGFRDAARFEAYLAALRRAGLPD